MTNLPPSIPPWSQAPPMAGPAPQPTLGAAPQPSAFTNPVVGAVASSPGGIPASVQSLFPHVSKNRRQLREAPLVVMAASAAIVAQCVFAMVFVAALAAFGGATAALGDYASDFDTSSSSSSSVSDGGVVLILGSMLLFVMVVGFALVAFQLLTGSWKAWFGAMVIQAFWLLVCLFLVIGATGAWVLGLAGPIGIAGLLLLPDARSWIATESNLA